MKNIKLASILYVVVMLLTACVEPGGLTNDQIDRANKASEKFFRAQIIEDKSGTSLGCMGSDSDRDGNVTCTGNVPYETSVADGERTKTVTRFRMQEAICSYEQVGGCKLKY